jgi:arylsulfatase A-like enzyme
MLRRCGAFALLAVLFACSSEPRPPNIVVYVVDTLRADHLGLYGYERDTSPRLEAFARDAVVYDEAYAPSSWTRPSTASLLTGLYPQGHGAIKRADAIAPNAPMMGELLQAAGYETAAFSTNVNVLPIWGFERGFDHFYDVDAETWRARSQQVNEVVFQHLDEHSNEPFFLYVHTRDPHVPYRPPPPFDAFWPAGPDDNVVNRYDGEIRANDHFFGELLDHLKARGLYDDSLILFTSDHGEEMLDRGEVGHGYSLFQEVVGIPFVVKYPGNRDGGTRRSGPAALIDVLPTVLGVAGIAPPAETDGVDLRQRAASAERPLFFDLNLLLQGKRYVMDGVRLGRHKLIDQVEPRRQSLLYDLPSDPGERHALAGTETAVAQHLGGVLREFRSAGSSGLQLIVVGSAEAQALEAEVTLRTSGRFVNLRGMQFEDSDAATLSEDGRVLHIVASLPSRPNPVGEEPLVLVDTDRIGIEVEPATAEVSVELMRLGGAPAPVFTGPKLVRHDETPLVFRRDAPDLVVERMDTLLPLTAERSVTAAAGLYIGSVAPAGAEVEIDPETERRLAHAESHAITMPEAGALNATHRDSRTLTGLFLAYA